MTPGHGCDATDDRGIGLRIHGAGVDFGPLLEPSLYEFADRPGTYARDVVLCSDELALERAHMYDPRSPALQRPRRRGSRRGRCSAAF